MDKELEEGSRLNLDFSKLRKIFEHGHDVIPAVAQDIETGAVLIIGYINELALRKSSEIGLAVFWSTSRNELWIKGSTSGDTLELIDVRINCEQNSVLYLVSLKGVGACHTRDQKGNSRLSCFYRTLKTGKLQIDNSYPPAEWGSR